MNCFQLKASNSPQGSGRQHKLRKETGSYGLDFPTLTDWQDRNNWFRSPCQPLDKSQNTQPSHINNLHRSETAGHADSPSHRLVFHKHVFSHEVTKPHVLKTEIQDMYRYQGEQLTWMQAQNQQPFLQSSADIRYKLQGQLLFEGLFQFGDVSMRCIF